MHDPRRGRRGAVTLEFALVVPTFLLIAMAMITFGHAAVVRSEMSNAAMVAARTGVLSGRRDQGSAQNTVTRLLGNDANACGQVGVSVNDVLLVNGQRTFAVTVQCNFRAGLTRLLASSFGIQLPPLIVRASMPF